MGALTGNTISSSYLGLLKTGDNAVLNSTLRLIEDGGGTDASIKLSTTQLGLSDGTTTVPSLTFSSNSDTGFYYSSDVTYYTLNGTTQLAIGSASLTLNNDSKLQWGTSDVYIKGTTSTDNIQLGLQGATKLTLHQTTGLTLAQYGSGSITGTVTQRLGVTSAGQVVEIPIGGGAVDGSGTAGKITKWTDSDTIGDSIMSESGSTISIVDTLKINATTGDSLLQFNITGDTYSMGIDNSDADKFKLAYGVFGSTDLLAIDVDGNSIFSGSLTINKESSSALTISNPSATNDYLLIGHDASLNSLYTSRAENSYGTHTFRQWDGTTTRSILTLDASQNATFEGDVGMGKLTATKSGTAGVFNSGTTNVVASFTSTDGTGVIQLADSGGNVEIGAAGNDFVVQPAGGVAQLTVGSSSSTFAGNVTLTSTAPLLHLANTTSSTGKTWRLSSASNGKFFITQEGVIDAITLDHTTGNATFAGSLDVGNFTFSGSGIVADSNMTIQTDGGSVNAITLASDGDATFAGEISSGDDINVVNGKLTVNNTSAEVRIKSTSDTGESFINFADPSDNNVGQIYYGHGTNKMSIRVNDATRLEIDSSGNSTFAGDVAIKSAGGNNVPADLSLWHSDVSIVSGDGIGVISAEGSDSGGSPPYQGAKILFDASANWDTGTSNYYPTNIKFFTQDNSGTDTIAAGARMTIGSDGNSTFAGDVTIDNSSPEFYLTPDSAKYSWMIAAQENVDQHFEITPSTTVGGTTFNAPALKIDGASSNATFAGDVSVSDGVQKSKFETNGNDLYLVANSGQTNVSPNFVFKSSVGGGTINEKMRLDSSGRLGLNTSSPSSYNSNTNNFVIRDSGSGGMTISTGASNTGYLAFNDGEDTTIEGLIAYNHSSDSMSFRTNSVDDRLVIDSSGNATFAGSVNAKLSNIAGLQNMFNIENATNTSVLASFGLNLSNDQLILGSDYAASFLLKTGGTTAITIDTSQNATFAGTILSGSTDSIRKSVNDSVITISGGNATNVGANYSLFGGTHASLSNIHRWRIGGSEAMRLDSDGHILLGTDNKVGWRYSSGDISYNFITGEDQILTLTGGTWTTNATQSAVRIKTVQGEKVTVLNNGNVGLATDSPQAQLHINQDASNAYATLRLEGSNRGGIIEMYNAAYPVSKIQTDQSGNIGIYTSGAFASTTLTEKVAITTAGAIGIGKAPTSGYKLDIEANNQRLRLLGTTGFVSAEVQNNGGSFSMGKENSSGGGFYSTTGAYDSVLVSQGAVNMIFGTNNAERMRIDAIGNIQVSPHTGSNIGYGLQISPQGGYAQIYMESDSTDSRTIQRFYNPNGNVGNISISGSATTYATSSDYRLKENVVELTGALDRVSQLKPSRFNFIADADKVVDGFLAHEVQDIVPEAITGEKDAVDDEGNPDYQGIDQSKLVPLLVGAIQELEARVQELEKEI